MRASWWFPIALTFVAGVVGGVLFCVVGAIVVTGGNQPGDRTTEAMTGFAYLRDRGVPEEALVVENRSTNTWEQLLATEQGMALLAGLQAMNHERWRTLLTLYHLEQRSVQEVSQITMGLKALAKELALIAQFYERIALAGMKESEIADLKRLLALVYDNIRAVDEGDAGDAAYAFEADAGDATVITNGRAELRA